MACMMVDGTRKATGVLGRVEERAWISSAGAVAGTQHEVVDVVRSSGGPGRTGSLVVSFYVPCR